LIIFLDESGDLGFDFSKPKTSRKFVITLLVCDDSGGSNGFKKAVRRTLKNKLNHKKNNSRVVQELKGTGTTLAVKEYFYRQIPDDCWRIYTVALNKARVETRLRSPQGKKKLYNFLARFLLQHVNLSNAAPAVTLVVDRCKNKEEVKDFNGYVANQLESLLPLSIPLNIYHESSQDNPGLQAVDLFSWGIFRKYESQDLEWYRNFSGKIAFETEYLK
jgi:hypothetical protein